MESGADNTWGNAIDADVVGGELPCKTPCDVRKSAFDGLVSDVAWRRKFTCSRGDQQYGAALS